MCLSENIRYLRTKKGYSQEYVAKKLGYKSFTTIQKWESGISEPPVKKLKELSVLFGVDMDDINNTRLSLRENFSTPSNQHMISLSQKEEKLIADFRKLNEQGKDYILQTMDMVKDKYKKCDTLSELEDLG